MQLSIRRAAALLLASGFCALIYQVTWLREFRLFFGGSTAASAAVIGVFMAGVGAGGIVLGRRVEADARPLRFYGWLELGISVSAALTPALLFAGRALYLSLGGKLSLGLAGGTIVRLLLSCLIIGTPAFLMGGTLPAASRAAVTADDQSRRGVGLLYGVNTLGAVSGVLVATFFLIEHFGNHLTLWLASALNLTISLIALSWSKTLEPANPSLPNKQPQRNNATRIKPTAVVPALFSLPVAASVGFAFFLMELVWYRMLSPLLGGTTFGFGLILATALAGIGVGASVYGALTKTLRQTVGLFALTCALEALFIAVPYALGDRIAVIAMLLRPLGTIGFSGFVAGWAIICFIVVFPASVMAGFQFPVLIGLLGSGRDKVGKHSGAVYGWNTAGALLGSLAGGFGFLPAFSAPGVWKIVVVILFLVSLASTVCAVSRREHWARLLPPLAVGGLAVCLLIFSTGPTAFWRHSPIGAGRAKKFEASPNELRNFMEAIRRQTIWEKDGVESSVAISNSDSYSFVVNGKSDGNAKADAGTQVMSGLLGAALHPHPSNAMVIGLGTGSTAGWLAAVPTIDRVDVFELEPAILHVAEMCAPVNHDALANPKLHVTIGDARECLQASRQTYDVIASEPSNPYRAGVAGLFSKEFYQSVAKRLRPGGLFTQWVQGYDVDDRTVQIIYRTLSSVFPNVETWQTTDGDLVLMCSAVPVRFDIERLRSRLAQEPYRTALPAVWRANSVEDFLAYYVGNNDVTRILGNSTDTPLNTDDRTVLEYSFARNIDVQHAFEIPDLRAAVHGTSRERPTLVTGAVDWQRVEEARISTLGSTVKRLLAEPHLPEDERHRADAFFHYCGGDLRAAIASWQKQKNEPQTLGQLTVVAEGLAGEHDPKALTYIDKLAKDLPLDAEMLRAEYFWRQKADGKATDVLEHLFAELRDQPWCHTELIARALAMAEGIANDDDDDANLLSARLYRAITTPFSVCAADEFRRIRLFNIAQSIDGENFSQYTVRALEAGEPHVPWERRFLETRAAAYQRVGSPLAEQASLDLGEFVRHEASLLEHSPLSYELRHGVKFYGTEKQPDR